MKLFKRIAASIAFVAGGLAALVAFLWFVPFSPAMIYPLYWQLTGFLANEPLEDLVRTDVTAKVCPMVTQRSVANVAEHRTGPADVGFPPNGLWIVYEPKSLSAQCRDFRIRHLSFAFDAQTGQCSAEARNGPVCDF